MITIEGNSTSDRYVQQRVAEARLSHNIFILKVTDLWMKQILLSVDSLPADISFWYCPTKKSPIY